MQNRRSETTFPIHSRPRFGKSTQGEPESKTPREEAQNFVLGAFTSLKISPGCTGGDNVMLNMQNLMINRLLYIHGC